MCGWGQIVEIGGGYGNMARLMGAGYGFKDWTIFDMRFMNRLQKHYLEQTLGASGLSLPPQVVLFTRAMLTFHAAHARCRFWRCR